MKCDNLKYNLTWPGMALCLLLQRAPLLKCLVAAEFALAPRVLHVAKVLLTPAVSVGIYNTVTGATGDFEVSGSAEGTVGENLAVAVRAEGVATPRKVEITGELPPGIVTNQDSDGEVPNGTLLFSGIPTQAGVYLVTARVLTWGDPNAPIRSIDLKFVISLAGPDITQIPLSQRVILGYTLILEVQVEDETGVIYQWQKDAGQGFGDIVGATERVYSVPNVTVEVEGSYRVRVTKNDVVEIVPRPDEPAYITVEPGSALRAWTNTHFDDPDSQEAQELGNPDRDALSNLIEFVFDLDPQVPDTGQIPVISSEIIQEMSYRVFTFPALNLSAEIEVLAEGSDNLDSSEWTPLVDGEDGVVIEQTSENFVIKLPLSTRIFSRLRVRVLEP